MTMCPRFSNYRALRRLFAEISLFHACRVQKKTFNSIHCCMAVSRAQAARGSLDIESGATRVCSHRTKPSIKHRMPHHKHAHRKRNRQTRLTRIQDTWKKKVVHCVFVRSRASSFVQVSRARSRPFHPRRATGFSTYVRKFIAQFCERHAPRAHAQIDANRHTCGRGALACFTMLSFDSHAHRPHCLRTLHRREKK